MRGDGITPSPESYCASPVQVAPTGLSHAQCVPPEIKTAMNQANSSKRREEVASNPDLVLVGAGLANALIAFRLAVTRPDVRMLMLEGSFQPFGEHTWSFHASDLTGAEHEWLSPMVARRWGAQSVRFDGYRRDLSTGYACLNSKSVAAVLSTLPNLTLKTGATATHVERSGVMLEGGGIIKAPCVIDGRGFAPNPALALGYQKFVGLEVETETPHGIADPVIMDATVDQKDGYRFVYLLPFSETHILIEDTRYSDSGALLREELVRDIHLYAKAQGWTIARVVREEQGVLPISLAHDIDGFWSASNDEVPRVGMAAGLFHPTTGYSLPEAVRLASLVAQHWPLDSAALVGLVRRHAVALHRRQRYYRMLNRFLFLGAAPSRRHLVMRRFYMLPQPLIERFYAGRLTAADKLRILAGKPPIPIRRALAVLREAPLLARTRA